jgi:hypothetical protein
MTAAASSGNATAETGAVTPAKTAAQETNAQK